MGRRGGRGEVFATASGLSLFLPILPFPPAFCFEALIVSCCDRRFSADLAHFLGDAYNRQCKPGTLDSENTYT